MKFPRKTTMQDDEAPVGAESNAPRPEGTDRPGRFKSQPRKVAKRGYLDGQMLIAMPSMGDDRFARSVIYEAALGIDRAALEHLHAACAPRQLDQLRGAQAA